MIISKTPFRISFFGGGTDMEGYFNKYGGSVISTTFDKYCYVVLRHLPHFFDYTDEFSYAVIERVNDVEEIKHPLIRNCMKMLDMKDIKLSYDADLLARSGLGTSSSFAVGMLNAFHTLKKDKVNKKQLADEAIYAERVLCNEAGGWQDQIAASFGGFNRIDFDSNGYHVTNINISAERMNQLNDNLLLFFTGFTRFSSDIQKENKDKEGKEQVLQKMQQLVDKAQQILEDKNSDLDEFGKLLDIEWNLKRKTGNKVSTDKIDEIYSRGLNAGALGGKLLGAGGGGFFIFYVPEDKREAVLNEFKELIHIPFRFEDGGTQIIYNGREKYIQRCER